MGMRKFIKKHWYDLAVCGVFVVMAILGIVAMTQVLGPINESIDNKTRIAAVLGEGGITGGIKNDIAGLEHTKGIFVWLYLSVIGFFLFMAVARIFIMLNRRMNKFVMPAVGLINTVILFIGSCIAGVGFDNLGVTGGRFLPGIFVFVIPLLFMGVLPLLSGIKNVFKLRKQ